MHCAKATSCCWVLAWLPEEHEPPLEFALLDPVFEPELCDAGVRGGATAGDERGDTG
jgi:hypothetical protein